MRESMLWDSWKRGFLPSERREVTSPSPSLWRKSYEDVMFKETPAALRQCWEGHENFRDAEHLLGNSFHHRALNPDFLFGEIIYFFMMCASLVDILFCINHIGSSPNPQSQSSLEWIFSSKSTRYFHHPILSKHGNGGDADSIRCRVLGWDLWAQRRQR